MVYFMPGFQNSTAFVDLPSNAFLMKIFRLIFFILCYLLFSCQAKPVKIPGFDAQVWKNDRLGCKGQRAAFISSLSENQPVLFEMGQMQLTRLFGRPDATELYKRNQRFFIYYYEPGPQCRGEKIDIYKGKALRIRISALDKVTEISFK